MNITISSIGVADQPRGFTGSCIASATVSSRSGSRVVDPVWWIPCGGSRVVNLVWWIPCGGSRVVDPVWWIPCGGSRVVDPVWWIPCGGSRVVDPVLNGILLIDSI